jgi:hypothetical protein
VCGQLPYRVLGTLVCRCGYAQQCCLLATQDLDWRLFDLKVMSAATNSSYGHLQGCDDCHLWGTQLAK